MEKIEYFEYFLDLFPKVLCPVLQLCDPALRSTQKPHLGWVKSSMKNISLLFLNDSFAFQIIRPVYRLDKTTME